MFKQEKSEGRGKFERDTRTVSKNLLGFGGNSCLHVQLSKILWNHLISLLVVDVASSNQPSTCDVRALLTNNHSNQLQPSHHHIFYNPLYHIYELKPPSPSGAGGGERHYVYMHNEMTNMSSNYVQHIMVRSKQPSTILLSWCLNYIKFSDLQPYPFNITF